MPVPGSVIKSALTKDFNILVFLGLILLNGVLFFVFFISYLAIEEGYPGENYDLVEGLARGAYVARFPMHNILWDLMDKCSGIPLLLIFLFGLIVNAVLYAYLCERVYTFLSGWRKR